MKRLVCIFVFPIALLLGHLLFYSAGCEYLNAQSLHISEYNVDAVIADINCTDTPFFRDGEDPAESQNKESVESLAPVTYVKKASSEINSGNAAGIFKSGKLINSNTLYDYLNALSCHTSGVRATVDRLFTLGIVRC